MQKVNLATTAIVSVLVATGIAATVVIALAAGMLVANNQRDNSVSACERGNVAREALRTTASIIQSNLAAASRADRGADATSVYAANIERLAAVKHDNPELDCEATIPEPSFLP